MTKAKEYRLSAVASSYPDIMKLINQDVNPIGAYCAVGATTVGLVGDLEDSTNQALTEKERHDASRDAGRKIALLITDITVAIAYNAAVDSESFGAGAAATGNVIGLERTANALSAKFANALGLPEFQQSLGLGDSTPYTNLTDIPSDAVMTIAGYDFLIGATKYRADLEKKFEEHTGVNINDALVVGRLGLRITESGLIIASGEIPDLEKVQKHSLSLAKKFGLDADKSQDFKMIADVVQGSITVANNIREGKFGAEDVSLIAKMSLNFARRANHYGITPEFAQDAEAVANVVASASCIVDGCMQGNINLNNYSQVLESSEIAIARLFKRGALLVQNAEDLSNAVKELRESQHANKGKIDINKMLTVTQQIVNKGVEQELVSKKSQDQIARTLKTAVNIPSHLLTAGVSLKKRKG